MRPFSDRRFSVRSCLQGRFPPRSRGRLVYVRGSFAGVAERLNGQATVALDALCTQPALDDRLRLRLDAGLANPASA